jgi:hypothetical protein
MLPFKTEKENAMKTLVLLTVALLMMANVVNADHIGVHRNSESESCNLGNPGFNPNAVVVHKFSLGATGSRFKVTLPAGSSFFGFNTPYVPIGVLTSDLSLGYGLCLTGSFVLGTMVAILNPGTVNVLPADNFSNIIYTDCSFGELPATGGTAWVGGLDDCVDAVEPSTWGKVKSLYR